MIKDTENKIKESFEKLQKRPWTPLLQNSKNSDWRQEWFLDGKVAKVTNTDQGMLFEAGETFLDEGHHGVLWTKKEFEDPILVEFDYKRMDREIRCVNILYIYGQGSGEAPFDRDILVWKDLRQVPRMSLYFKAMNMYHISFAAFENNEEVSPGYVRCRRYVSGPLEGTEIKPDYTSQGLFEPFVEYHVKLIVDKGEIYFEVKNSKSSKLFYWKDPKTDPLLKGRIGIRHMFTRKAIYANLKISSLRTVAKSNCGF